MRIESFRAELEKAEFDGYIATNVKNVYYFTGFMDTSEAALDLIIPLDGEPILLTPPLSYVAAREAAENCAVKGTRLGERLVDRLVEEILALKMKHLGFDTLPITTYLQLVEKLGGVKLTQSAEPVWALRRIKDGSELASIREAAKLADIGVEAGIEAIKPGVREYEVAAELEYAMRVRGSKGTAFETIVASGPRSAYPHGICSDRVIREGDFVILDLGAVYGEYRSDMTRTVVVGRPSPRQSKMLQIVSKAQEEAFRSVRAGLKTRDVDAVAREMLARSGYGEYFVHNLGHGVGLDIHEPPSLSPRSEEVLEKGNVITVEPGVYVPGFGGVRIEDTVLVHEYSGERMTKAPYHL